MKQSVNVHLSEFACRAVAGEDRDSARVAELVVRAIRCYLGDGGSSGVGWSYPSFPRAEEPAGAVEVRLSVDDDLWRSLEEEAGRQGASTQQMVVHATLWFAAEMDAGRLTERIAEGLDEAAGEGRAG